MDRLRIALVVDHFLPRVGGIELHVADVARRLQAAGHEPCVITTTPGADRVDQVPVIRIEAGLLPRFQVSPDPRAFFRLRSLLDGGQFDVVHVHSSIISPLAYSTVFWCQRLRIPHVLTGTLGLGQFVERRLGAAAAVSAIVRADALDDREPLHGPAAGAGRLARRGPAAQRHRRFGLGYPAHRGRRAARRQRDADERQEASPGPDSRFRKSSSG